MWLSSPLAESKNSARQIEQQQSGRNPRINNIKSGGPSQGATQPFGQSYTPGRGASRADVRIVVNLGRNPRRVPGVEADEIVPGVRLGT
jgi:hypothetical protein